VASPGAGAAGTVSAGNAGAFDASAINSQLDGSTGLAATPNLNLGTLTGQGADLSFTGTSGAAANSALGAAGTDAIGSVAPASSSGGFLNGLESAAGKAALPGAALAFEAAQGPQALPSSSSALASGGSVTAPLQALETQGANEAATGTLTPTQQANVEQYVQQQQNQLIQQLASQGITNPTKSSQYQAGLAQIQQNALAMQQQYITAAIQEATSAGGAASKNIASVANEQVQLDTDFQNSLAQAFGALGGSIGGGVNVKA
jgi:hypothetical protein